MIVTIYRYACMERPPAPGAIPRDGLQQIGYDRILMPEGRLAWGFAEYNRQLTDEEIEEYELELVRVEEET